MKFGQNFRDARKQLESTTQEIADKIGVSRSYIALIENGKRLPGKQHLAKIAKVLKVDKDKIIAWYLDDIKSKI